MDRWLRRLPNNSSLEYASGYFKPFGRPMPVMKIERTAYAEKA